MVEVFYRYRVHPAQLRAFEHAYGSGGPWVALFRGNAGYLGTRLFRHRTEPFVYVTVDAWESKTHYDEFRERNAERYAQLDAHFRLLHLEEHLLGYYEGEDEYPMRVEAHT